MDLGAPLPFPRLGGGGVSETGRASDRPMGRHVSRPEATGSGDGPPTPSSPHYCPGANCGPQSLAGWLLTFVRPEPSAATMYTSRLSLPSRYESTAI